MALLPWWDCKAMTEETYRAHKMGLRGVNINPEPYEHVDSNGQPLPDLGHSHWDSFWEVCQSLGMPVNFHIGASATSIDWGMSRGWPSAPTLARYAMGGSMAFFGNANTMGNIVFSGLLDRYPELKFVSVESGLGWIPFAMECWDYQVTQNDFRLQRRPSEYVKKNIYTSFWFERVNVSRDIKKVGVDNVMFETDFPHPGGLWPIDDVASAFVGLEETEIARVLYGNAVRVYNLPEQLG
jgi:predicted TIM-barrel fold metal-dependent hydrolase